MRELILHRSKLCSGIRTARHRFQQAYLLHERGVEVSVLESDVMRTQLTPFPRYDDADRDFFYATLGEVGILLVEKQRAVIFDATANLRVYRDAARKRIARFAEVFVDTPLELCAARDPKGLYRKAKTLPGVQAPYEPPLAPELIVRGAQGTPADAAREIVEMLGRRRWV